LINQIENPVLKRTPPLLIHLKEQNRRGFALATLGLLFGHPDRDLVIPAG
jgi:hypothetical protein